MSTLGEQVAAQLGVGEAGKSAAASGAVEEGPPSLSGATRLVPKARPPRAFRNSSDPRDRGGEKRPAVRKEGVFTVTTSPASCPLLPRVQRSSRPATRPHSASLLLMHGCVGHVTQVALAHAKLRAVVVEVTQRLHSITNAAVKNMPKAEAPAARTTAKQALDVQKAPVLLLLSTAQNYQRMLRHTWASRRRS